MIPASVAIFAATASVDMRRSFDGLAELARSQLKLDPGCGAIFVFFNKRRDRIKLLWREGAGDCLLYKRLEHGTFHIPSALPGGTASVAIDARELARILEGIPLPHRRETAREIARIARNKVLQLQEQAGIFAST
jgi:transposase